VVQLYAATPAASVPCPRLRLADFARVHIAAGATVAVQLAVPPKAHRCVGGPASCMVRVCTCVPLCGVLVWCACVRVCVCRVRMLLCV
jgi:hypothetical protein